jgi:hypothetical protein
MYIQAIRRNSSRDSYKNNDISIKTKHIYLSMTTIPERLQNNFFYKLLENNLQICKKYNKNRNIVAKLIINIPYKFNKTQESYIITDKLEKLQKKHGFIINRCDDEGPITKILPTLRLSRFIKDDDLILVMDDDNMVS